MVEIHDNTVGQGDESRGLENGQDPQHQEDPVVDPFDLSQTNLTESQAEIEPSVQAAIDAEIDAAIVVEEALDNFLLETATELNLSEEKFQELSDWVDHNIRDADLTHAIKEEAVSRLTDTVALAKRLETEGLADAPATISDVCSRIEHSLARGKLDKIDKVAESVEFKARYPLLSSLDTKSGLNGKLSEFIDGLPEAEQAGAREVFNEIAGASGAKESLSKAASFPDFHAQHTFQALIDTAQEPGGMQAIQQFGSTGGWRHSGTAHLLIHSKAIRGRIECGGCRYSDLEASLPAVIENQLDGAEKLKERLGSEPYPSKQFGYLTTGQTYEQGDGTMIHLRWHTPEPSFTSSNEPVAIVTKRDTGEFLLHVESSEEYRKLSRAVDRVSDGKMKLGKTNPDGGVWIEPELWDMAREKGGVQARVILGAGHIVVDPREEIAKRSTS